MKSAHEDRPKSLQYEEVKQERIALRKQGRVKQLNEYVEKLRSETGRGNDIPYFDPLDGGLEAKCLFLFEAAGPKAVDSGFASRNNPDESAKKFFELNKRVGLDRCLTISWNIVPWYLGSDGRIRAAKCADIVEGSTHLWGLFELLGNTLKVAVLSGRKAQVAASAINSRYPHIEVLEMWHPSPQSLNREPSRSKEILKVLNNVKRLIS